MLMCAQASCPGPLSAAGTLPPPTSSPHSPLFSRPRDAFFTAIRHRCSCWRKTFGSPAGVPSRPVQGSNAAGSRQRQSATRAGAIFIRRCDPLAFGERVKAKAIIVTGHSNPSTSIVPPRSNLTRPVDQYLEKIRADFEKIFQILRAFPVFARKSKSRRRPGGIDCQQIRAEPCQKSSLARSPKITAVSIGLAPGGNVRSRPGTRI